MPEILVKPAELDSSADQIRSSAARIQQAIEAVDAELQRMSGERFSGHRAEALRARYQAMRQTLMSFAPLLTGFGTVLNEAAAEFRKADTPQN